MSRNDVIRCYMPYSRKTENPTRTTNSHVGSASKQKLQMKAITRGLCGLGLSTTTTKLLVDSAALLGLRVKKQTCWEKYLKILHLCPKIGSLVFFTEYVLK